MKIFKQNQGQTLVLLLVFMIIAITVTTSAVMIISSNSLNATKLQQGTIDSHIAESGVENALLRLLRDPTYSGETLTVGEGTAIITVSGNPPTITSKGIDGNFTRTIQVTTSYNNGVLTVTSWKEINP